MLHQTLWQNNQDLAQACLQLPFVQGLADGSLANSAFHCYVAQDAFFLKAFLRAYALAAAKSEKLPQIKQFHDLIGGVLTELELHQKYASSLAIDLSQVKPLAATRAYTDFLLRTAWSASVAETVAAMTPCMRLYAWLGQQLKPHWQENHIYADWIQTYSDPEFEALAVLLENLLDELADELPSDSTPLTILDEAYRYAMVCEHQFFIAPLLS